MNTQSDPSVKVDASIDVRFASVIIPLILYLMAFSQLFHHKTTEYMAWILFFSLNCVFPFTWLYEFGKLASDTSGMLIIYSYFATMLTYFLQFIVLLFIVLKNENVRKGKVKRGEYEEGKQNIETGDITVEKRDNIISIFLILTNVFIWLTSSCHFSDGLELLETNGNLVSKQYPIGSKIKSMFSIIPNVMKTIYNKWRDLLNYIPMSSPTKAFSVYCITFVTAIVSLYIRPQFKKVRDTNTGNYTMTLNGYKTVNIGNVFHSGFYTDNIHYERVAKVLLVLLLTCFIVSVFLFRLYYNGTIFDIGVLHIILGIICVCFVILFSLFFVEGQPGSQVFKLKEKKDDLKTHEGLKMFFLYIIFLLFSVFGGGFLTAACSHVAVFFFEYNVSVGNVLIIFSTLSALMCLSLCSIFKVLLDDANHKTLQILLAVLYSMMISSFVALSTQPDMFTGVFKLLSIPFFMITKLVGPLLIIILSSVSVFYAYSNYKKYKYSTNK
jgi:hypothetical protein